MMLISCSDLKFAYFVCSIQKTIDRYKTYTREVVNNKTAQLDIQVTISTIISFKHSKVKLMKI
jgi:hypothetical protein